MWTKYLLRIVHNYVIFVCSIACCATIYVHIRVCYTEQVQPQEFVTFANYSSTTDGADSGGALLFTVFGEAGAFPSPEVCLCGFVWCECLICLLPSLMVDPNAVINPFGGALEGCFRAYTERRGPNSAWPGLLLATGADSPGAALSF